MPSASSHTWGLNSGAHRRREQDGGGGGERLAEGHKAPGMKMPSPGGDIQQRGCRGGPCVPHLRLAKRVDLKCSHHPRPGDQVR